MQCCLSGAEQPRVIHLTHRPVRACQCHGLDTTYTLTFLMANSKSSLVMGTSDSFTSPVGKRAIGARPKSITTCEGKQGARATRWLCMYTVLKSSVTDGCSFGTSSKGARHQLRFLFLGCYLCQRDRKIELGEWTMKGRLDNQRQRGEEPSLQTFQGQIRKWRAAWPACDATQTSSSSGICGCASTSARTGGGSRATSLSNSSISASWSVQG